MYYVKNYYTDEIIGAFSDFNSALSLAKISPDAMVISETNDMLYTNVELPF